MVKPYQRIVSLVCIACETCECEKCNVEDISKRIIDDVRADAIEECKKIVKEKCTTNCMYSDCIEGMCKQFEELKAEAGGKE